MAGRQWVKLYCYERLHGSVTYQLSEAEQSIWDKLLCLAGLCDMDGWICDHDGRAYPHAHIVHELHAEVAMFEETLKKCKAEGRISENMANPKKRTGLYITNWDKYQSEYTRQKPYRHKSKLEKEMETGPGGLLNGDNSIGAQRLRRVNEQLEREKGEGTVG